MCLSMSSQFPVSMIRLRLDPSSFRSSNPVSSPVNVVPTLFRSRPPVPDFGDVGIFGIFGIQSEKNRIKERKINGGEIERGSLRCACRCCVEQGQDWMLGSAGMVGAGDVWLVWVNDTTGEAFAQDRYSSQHI